MTFGLKDERGQAFALTALCLVVMLGMSAVVLDVGAWFRTDRKLQATSDAAALAGAQMLPRSPGNARTTALDYANKNGGYVKAGDIAVGSKYSTNDTITVKATKDDPGFFSKILGIDVVNINAHAIARTDSPRQVRNVAPMTVSCDHALIKNCSGNGTPTFNVRTTMEFDPMGAPGAFGMLNLNGNQGTVGTSDEALWITQGFDKYLDYNQWYRSDPGAKFTSSQLQDALASKKGSVLLFPVFRVLRGTGQNADYYIIGWIGFRLDDWSMHGNNAVLTGEFTEFIANGLLASSGHGAPISFGVRSIELIE